MIFRSIKHGDTAAGVLFLLPNFIGFLVFMLIPTLSSFIISLSEWRLLDQPSFVGLANFRELLRDSLFWRSFSNTAYFVFARVPLNIAVSLFMAIVLNRNLHGRTFFRAASFIPAVCSSVAVALIWQPLLDLDAGLVNRILRTIVPGLQPIPWLSSMQWAMPSVIMVAIWRDIGFFMVIFLAGLQGIPSVYYEAARIDGAGIWREFLHITLPMISPTMFFVLVTSIIGSFQIFDLTTIMTQGGPGTATNTLVMLVYQTAFRFFRMGYASAIAQVLFAVILVFTIVQNRLSKRWVHVD